jgi:hypothetical protein
MEPGRRIDEVAGKQRMVDPSWLSFFGNRRKYFWIGSP